MVITNALYQSRRKRTKRRNSIKLRFVRKCNSCGFRWKEVAYASSYPVCTQCDEEIDIIILNWWYSPKLILHHISHSWVSYFAFECDDRPFRNWFAAAFHCKMCFICIILLRVTVFPFVWLMENCHKGLRFIFLNTLAVRKAWFR